MGAVQSYTIAGPSVCSPACRVRCLCRLYFSCPRIGKKNAPIHACGRKTTAPVHPSRYLLGYGTPPLGREQGFL
jgi:hypothetical protein